MDWTEIRLALGVAVAFTGLMLLAWKGSSE